ncbi:hypothetical protein V9T40_002388 [Parthenolecanium corni]|uniref:CRAL-TRIO domain-containing protein n=1 Tax=Parthenolecanium corni TaxID=536013 RepID=A0AAN9Y5C0_9HEMI
MIDLGANLHPYSNGWRLFVDAGEYSFGHLLKVSMSLGYLKNYLTYVQTAMPIRLKGIHIYNSSPIVNQMIALCKPFINRQLYEMIHTYTCDELNSLFEFIRPEMLPVSSGGEMCAEEMKKDTLDNIKKYEQWFIDDQRLGRTDESKRKRKPGRLGWLFGYGATTEDNLEKNEENDNQKD